MTVIFSFLFVQFFSLSFVVNPLAPIQETVCLLQNETTGANPTVSPQKSVSTYYMIKLNIRSGMSLASLLSRSNGNLHFFFSRTFIGYG